MCSSVRGIRDKAVFPFCGNMNLYRAGYNSPQKLNVFLQEIEIRICKKHTIFLHCYIVPSFTWIADKFLCHPILGGNLSSASVDRIHRHDNGDKMHHGVSRSQYSTYMQWSWHNLMQIQFWKFSADSQGLEWKPGWIYHQSFHILMIPKKRWIIDIFAISWKPLIIKAVVQIFARKRIALMLKVEAATERKRKCTLIKSIQMGKYTTNQTQIYKYTKQKYGNKMTKQVLLWCKRLRQPLRERKNLLQFKIQNYTNGKIYN